MARGDAQVVVVPVAVPREQLAANRDTAEAVVVANAAQLYHVQVLAGDVAGGVHVPQPVGAGSVLGVHQVLAMGVLVHLGKEWVLVWFGSCFFSFLCGFCFVLVGCCCCCCWGFLGGSFFLFSFVLGGVGWCIFLGGICCLFCLFVCLFVVVFCVFCFVFWGDSVIIYVVRGITLLY